MIACLLFTVCFVTHVFVCRGLQATDPGAKGEAVVKDVVKQIHGSGIFPEDKCFLIRIAWVESKYGNDANTYSRPAYHGGIWQVDSNGFQDTQDTSSHPGLNNKFTKIQTHFGIFWPNVTWQDLRKPLYSGLAARLFLSNVPSAIPSDINGQATYWKTHYNTVAGAGTEQKFIDDVAANGQLSVCGTDGEIIEPPTTTDGEIITPPTTTGESGESVTKNAIMKVQESEIFPDDNCFLARIAWVESKFGTDPDTYRAGYYGGIWQVNEAAFDDTQATSLHSLLPGKFEKIFDNFRIEWVGVEWKKLVDPLHSVLAARLYLSNFPPAIPATSDLDGQADYWSQYYHGDTGDTAEKFLSGLSDAPADLCSKPEIVTTSSPDVTTKAPDVTTKAPDVNAEAELCYDIPGEDGDTITFLNEPSIGLEIRIKIEALPDKPDVKVVAELFITIGSFYMHVDFDGATHNGEHFSWSTDIDIQITTDISLHIDKTGAVLDFKKLVWLKIERKQKDGRIYINFEVNHIFGQMTKNAGGLIGSLSMNAELTVKSSLAELILGGLDGSTSLIELLPTSHCWKLPSSAMKSVTQLQEILQTNVVVNVLNDIF